MKLLIAIMVLFSTNQALACSRTIAEKQAGELAWMFQSDVLKEKIKHHRITRVDIEKNSYVVQTTGYCSVRVKPQYTAPEVAGHCPGLVSFAFEDICNNYRD